MKHNPISPVFVGNKTSSFFTLLGVRPQETPNKTVYISSGNYLKNGNEIVSFEGQNTPEIIFPETGHKWVLITLTNLNTIGIINGQEAPSDPAIPQFEPPAIPLALIYIKNSDTSIKQDMIYDVRPYFNVDDSSLNKSLWYSYIDNSKCSNTILNTETILLSKQSGTNGVYSIDVDGVTKSVYCIYNAVQSEIKGPISFSAKSTFDNDGIANWECNFVKTNHSNHSNMESFTIPSNSTNTRTFYNYGYTRIELENPATFSNNSISAQVGSDVLGTISSSNGYIEYFSSSGGVEVSIQFSQSSTSQDTNLKIRDYYFQTINSSISDTGVSIGTLGGTFSLDSMGTYKLFAISPFSDNSESIDIYISGNLVGTLSNSNKSISINYLSTDLYAAEINLVFNNFVNIGSVFDFGVVCVDKLSGYGNNPQLLISENNINVNISDLANTSSGTLTLVSKLYDDNSNIIETNNSISIILDLYEANYC